jgi:hypothetical protein
VLGAFRALAHRTIALPELAAYVDDAVRRGLAEFSQGEEGATERFVTALVDIPDDKPVIHVISCGHPPPLLLREAGATALRVREPAPPLGLGIVPNSAYAPTTFPFQAMDRLVLYTDGFTWLLRGGSGVHAGEESHPPAAARSAAVSGFPGRGAP